METHGLPAIGDILLLYLPHALWTLCSLALGLAARSGYRLSRSPGWILVGLFAVTSVVRHGAGIFAVHASRAMSPSDYGLLLLKLRWLGVLGEPLEALSLTLGIILLVRSRTGLHKRKPPEGGPLPPFREDARAPSP